MQMKPLLLILLFHLLLFIAVILDIPFVLPSVVFVYLLFVPGLVLLKLLKLNEIMIVKKVLFTVALSLAFLMFFGLLVNELFFAMGISMPLTPIPLLISLGFSTLVLSFFAYRHDLSVNLKLANFSSNPLGVLSKSIIVIIPFIFGILGSLYADVYIELLMVASIALLYGLIVFSGAFTSIRSMSLVLFVISLTLLLQVLLTSRYIMGWDANTEFYVFKLTADSGHWSLLSIATNSITASNYNSMLSITILPSIFYSLMHVSGEVVFKSIYPFVFSLVPVALFVIYLKQFGKTASILSVLFFVSGSLVFYGFEPLSLNRQIVGMLFLVLSILVILDSTMPFGKRRLLFIVFGAALIISHYSLALIYLFLVLFLYLRSRIKKFDGNILDFRLVSLLFILTFVWYSFTVSIAFSIAQALKGIIAGFISDFGNITSRVGPYLSGSHPALSSGVIFAGYTNWSFLILPNVLVVIGMIGLITGFFVKSTKWFIDPKYRDICLLSCFILLLCIVVPNFATNFNITRFYAITMLFLSPCIVMGGELIADAVKALWTRVASRNFVVNTKRVNVKRITKIFLYIVILGYFFSQSGFVNIVSGAVPLSYSLDYTRANSSQDQAVQIDFSFAYIPQQNVLSANWLLSHKSESVSVFADYVSETNVLVSYGLIPSKLLFYLTNTTVPQPGSFIYLGSLNIKDGVITTPTGFFNTSELSPILDNNNLIYSNGNSAIWYVPSGN